jgi:hypothetical protein
MAEMVSDRPGWLRVVSATVAAGVANLFWIVGRLVSCGEPPYPETFCDRGSLAVPWYVLALIAPSAVLICGILARRRGARVVFEMTWIALVCFGFLAPLGIAVVE